MGETASGYEEEVEVGSESVPEFGESEEVEFAVSFIVLEVFVVLKSEFWFVF